MRDSLVEAGVRRWDEVARRGFGVARPARRVPENLIVIPGVKVRAGLRHDVVGPADAGVTHDRAAAPGFERGAARAILDARAGVAVETVGGAELVPHLVADITHPEEVARRRVDSRGPAGLVAAAAHHRQLSDAPLVCPPNNMPDVVAAAADHRVAVALVLLQHRQHAGVGVRVRGGVRVHQVAVVRHQREADRALVLKDLRHPVDPRDDRGLPERDGAPMERRELPRPRHRQLKRAERRAAGAFPILTPETVGVLPAEVRRLLGVAPVISRNAAQVLNVITRVVDGVGLAERIDVVRAVGPQHARVKTLGREVQPDVRRRIIQPLPAIRADLGKLNRERGRHYRRFDNGEERKPSIRARDRDLDRHRLWPILRQNLHRRNGQDRLQTFQIRQTPCRKLRGSYPGFRADHLWRHLGKSRPSLLVGLSHARRGR